MKVVLERCAGLDVHKKSVVVCALTPGVSETRTFSTTTRGLRELLDWLDSLEITHVAMESTGIYWKPVWNILEEVGLHQMLVNAHHFKQVPGRKTDVKDAEWIATLARHGLLKGSFVPPKEQRELRELVRYRRTLIRTRASEVQRLQKILEGANIKLDSVISDLMGVSGKAMLRAIMDGATQPEAIASAVCTRLKASPEQLKEALEGQVGPHQRMLLKTLMQHIEHIDGAIATLDTEVEDRLRPFQELTRRIDDVPGFALRAAQDVLTEIGMNMDPFPTPRHLTSWAKVCPGSQESAGKNKSGRTGRGNPWLRSILNEAAQAARMKKGSYFAELYRRIAARRGSRRAIMAISRTLLEIIWCLIKRGTKYKDLGPNYLDQLHTEAIVARTLKRLKKLGYDALITKIAA